MANRTNIAVKVIFLTWAIFIPYYLLVLSWGLNHSLPRYPWPAVIGLSYFAGGISVVVFVAKRMFRRSLLEESISFESRTSALDGIALNAVYVSSPDHLQLVQCLPWYAKWL